MGICLLGGLAVATARAADEFLPGSPVVAQNSHDRLEVFRIDSQGELYHKWQKEVNGDWSTWVSLGGWLLPAIAVGIEPDGRLEVFAVDRRSKLLRYKWQADPNHLELDWSTWTTLG
jgi:hypothetical protein